MRVWLASVALVMLLLSPFAYAQASLDEQYQAFRTTAPKVEDLAALAASAPNLFVYAVQAMLAERDAFGGEASGLLDSSTIREINAFCADVGISDACGRGPLGDEGSAALAAALLSYDETVTGATVVGAPAAETPAKPASTLPTASAKVAAASDAVAVPLSVYWGPAIQNGLEMEVISGGAEAPGPFVIRIYGTAREAGFSNISMIREQSAALTEHWRFSTEVAVVGGSGDNLTMTLRVALRNATDFVGDLVPGGTSLSNLSNTAQTFSVDGIVDVAATAAVQPFIHLRYAQGAKVDITLELAPPVATRR